MSWPGEWCKRCGRRSVVGFRVSDSVWNRVSQGRWGVLCTSCFDEEAELAGVAYSLLETFPVTWSDWSTGVDANGAPV